VTSPTHALLSRIEDAGLNASAPPQQRWLDGWLLRFSPGKAKRARCINAVAPGRLPLADKLALAMPVFEEAGLPLIFRVTPFSMPEGLDAELAARGFTVLDDTRVMVCPQLPVTTAPVLPAGLQFVTLGSVDYADAVGELRGSPAAQRAAHAERLAHSPVRYQGYALQDESDGRVLACGQFAIEAELVGLYDVFTRESERGRGLASSLCRHLLVLAAGQGARVAYLQVEGDNLDARHIYQRLGFADAYAYHYRAVPASAG
jgi:GNAT superfamily N-acetyltransferase